MGYLQITTKCTMSCDHCCFGCNTDAGEHMTMETARNALRLFDCIGDTYLTIGGGEPTMHPKFWDMFGLVWENSPELENVFMATNGSLGKRALAMLSLSIGSDKLRIELSQDIYHDPIDQDVVKKFARANCIRSVQRILPQGSALANYIHTEESGCACKDISVRPNGDVTQCGCLDSPVLFNVNNSWDLTAISDSHCCWKDLEDEDDSND